MRVSIILILILVLSGCASNPENSSNPPPQSSTYNYQGVSSPVIPISTEMEILCPGMMMVGPEKREGWEGGLTLSIPFYVQVEGESHEDAKLLVCRYRIDADTRDLPPEFGAHYSGAYFRPWPAGTACEVEDEDAVFHKFICRRLLQGP